MQWIGNIFYFLRTPWSPLFKLKLTNIQNFISLIFVLITLLKTRKAFTLLNSILFVKIHTSLFNYQVSQKNVPLGEVCPSPKGTFFLGHPVDTIYYIMHLSALDNVHFSKKKYFLMQYYLQCSVGGIYF